MVNSRISETTTLGALVAEMTALAERHGPNTLVFNESEGDLYRPILSLEEVQMSHRGSWVKGWRIEEGESTQNAVIILG